MLKYSNADIAGKLELEMTGFGSKYPDGFAVPKVNVNMGCYSVFVCRLY